MKPERKQRLLVVVFIVVVTGLVVGLLSYALRENINLFYTPSQVAAGEAPTHQQIRVGGMVVADSFERASDSLDSTFLVSDGSATFCRTFLPRTRLPWRPAHWVLTVCLSPSKCWPNTMKNTPRQKLPMPCSKPLIKKQRLRRLSKWKVKH